MSDERTIRLAHGSGGRLMHELIEQTIARKLGNPVLSELGDSARLDGLLPGGASIAFTTDSYVVQPLFFPGGDIGRLAVAGTVNDLAVAGARPVCISLAFVIEEGLPVADLERVLGSVAATADAAGVRVVTGDTKVVERCGLGGLVVNTSGIGVLREGVRIGADRARHGDAVILSGTIGDHETAILIAREELSIGEVIESDCAPLGGLVEAVLEACPEVRAMRDPTRGGLATTLCEIAESSGVGITIDESAIPIRRSVASVCDILGFDPVYMANEGKAVIVAPGDAADRVVDALHSHELGRDAAVVGEVVAGGGVTMRTRVGGARPVVMLEGVQLPRIC